MKLQLQPLVMRRGIVVLNRLQAREAVCVVTGRICICYLVRPGSVNLRIGQPPTGPDLVTFGRRFIRRVDVDVRLNDVEGLRDLRQRDIVAMPLHTRAQIGTARRLYDGFVAQRGEPFRASDRQSCFQGTSLGGGRARHPCHVLIRGVCVVQLVNRGVRETEIREPHVDLRSVRDGVPHRPDSSRVVIHSVPRRGLPRKMLRPHVVLHDLIVPLPHGSLHRRVHGEQISDGRHAAHHQQGRCHCQQQRVCLVLQRGCDVGTSLPWTDLRITCHTLHKGCGQTRPGRVDIGGLGLRDCRRIRAARSLDLPQLGNRLPLIFAAALGDHL